MRRLSSSREMVDSDLPSAFAMSATLILHPRESYELNEKVVSDFRVRCAYSKRIVIR